MEHFESVAVQPRTWREALEGKFVVGRTIGSGLYGKVLRRDPTQPQHYFPRRYGVLQEGNMFACARDNPRYDLVDPDCAR